MTRHTAVPILSGSGLETLFYNVLPKTKGIIFSNEGSRGRKPLFDVSEDSSGSIMAYWKDELQKCIIITAPEPGYEVLAPEDMTHFFCYLNEGLDGKSLLTFLDVTHLDVSKTRYFTECFREFGASKPSKIIGIETWDVSSGERFWGMFRWAFAKTDDVHLDLSNWRFPKTYDFSMQSMFESFGFSSKNIELNLNGWNVDSCSSFRAMFQRFGYEASKVNLLGFDTWTFQKKYKEISMRHMFSHFSPESDCHIDLSGWNNSNVIRAAHKGFATGTFFKIKQPKWG